MTASSGLEQLIGKKIARIEVAEYDQYSDNERVDQIYRFIMDDGSSLHFMVDGGDCGHYGTFNPISVDENGVPEDNEYGKLICPYEPVK